MYVFCLGKVILSTDDGTEVEVEVVVDGGACPSDCNSFEVQELFVDNSVDSIDSVVIPVVPDFTHFLDYNLISNDQRDTVMSRADSEIESCESDKDPDYVPEANEDCESDDSVANTSQVLQYTAAETFSTGNASGSAECPESVSHPNDHSRIVVMTTNNVGGRKYDKRSYCYFSGMPQSKLMRHLIKKHDTESMVEDLTNPDKTKRDMALVKLRNLGNHSHNESVAEKGEGEFLVMYRPHQEDADYRKYVSCKYCYGYLLKTVIWKHNCPMAPTSADGTKLRRLRKASGLLPAADATPAFAVKWHETG